MARVTLSILAQLVHGSFLMGKDSWNNRELEALSNCCSTSPVLILISFSLNSLQYFLFIKTVGRLKGRQRREGTGGIQSQYQAIRGTYRRGGGGLTTMPSLGTNYHLFL